MHQSQAQSQHRPRPSLSSPPPCCSASPSSRRPPKESRLGRSACLILAIGVAAVLVHELWPRDAVRGHGQAPAKAASNERAAAPRVCRRQEDVVMSGAAGDGPPLHKARPAEMRRRHEQTMRRREGPVSTNTHQRYYRRDGTRAQPDETVYIVQRPPVKPPSDARL